MAGVKISALPAVLAAQLTDFFPVVQGGVTSQETIQQILDLFQGKITSLGAQTQALNMNTHLINSVVDPVSAQDAATKNYVDTLIAAVATVFAARVATTGALTVTYANGSSGVGATLTNAGAQVALSIDGVALSVGNLVLVKNQASALQNGYYSVTNIGSGSTNWVMTRSTLYDQPSEINPGDLFVITAGTANANTTWIETATVTTIGTDSISFSQYSVALPIPVSQGGTGLTSMTAYGVLTGGTTSTGNVQVVTPGASGTILQSGGAASLPTWTTSTYPATNAINTLLYASSANVMSALATANSAWLTTSSGGVPTWNTTLPFNQVSIQRVTTSGAGTYTPTTGMKYVIVQAQAAGGGGGGAANSAAGQFSIGSGAGGGEYIEALFTASQIGASKAYVVGAKGTGGASGGNNGGNGGNTTFNTTWIITNGGGQGLAGSTNAGSQFFYAEANTGLPGQGGSVSTGTLIKQITGDSGKVSQALVTQCITSGGGKAGSGQPGAINHVTTGVANGTVSLGAGGGGEGGASVNAAGTAAGGNGGDGFITFIEFLSV